MHYLEAATLGVEVAMLGVYIFLGVRLPLIRVFYPLRLTRVSMLDTVFISHFSFERYLTGCTGEFSSPKQGTFYHYNDFWRLEPSSREWTRLETKGKGPPARSGHRMTYFKVGRENTRTRIDLIEGMVSELHHSVWWISGYFANNKIPERSVDVRLPSVHLAQHSVAAR